MKLLEIICNLITVPIKIIIAPPLTIIALVGLLTGYEEPAYIMGKVLFERWFDFE
jgi:hypothetical protein